MVEHWRRISRSSVCIGLAVGFVLLCSSLFAAQPSKPQFSLWFDPTQLPSFTGVVDRFLPNPDGHVDRLIFKEGPQIVFPPDAFEAVREVAPAGHHLSSGASAREARRSSRCSLSPLPMASQRYSTASIGDRSLVRAGRRRDAADRHGLGAVPVAARQNRGRDPGEWRRYSRRAQVAAILKDRFVAGGKIAAEGTGVDTPFGKAIDAERIGDSIATLERLPSPEPASPGGGAPSESEPVPMTCRSRPRALTEHNNGAGSPGFLRQFLRLAGPYLYLGRKMDGLDAADRRSRPDPAADRHRGPPQFVEPRFFQCSRKPRLERLHAARWASSPSWRSADDGHCGLPGLCQAVAAVALAALVDRKLVGDWLEGGRHYQLDLIDPGSTTPTSGSREHQARYRKWRWSSRSGIFD